MVTQQAPQRAETIRRYDIDWLRVLAILAVFLFHSARFFNAGESWHVKNNVLSSVPDVFIAVFALWMMPLFFVLSGVSTYYALGSRSAGEFVRRRTLRLAIPLVTAGWFLLSPPQVYIERVTGTGYNTTPFAGSFLDYLPHYFEGIYGLGGNFALTGMHLWYLFWLFLFSLLVLPLLLFLRSRSGRGLVAALARPVELAGGIFLFALPLLLLELVLKEEDLGLGMQEGGWFLLSYIVLLVYGFLLPYEPRLEQAIQKGKWPALVVGVICMVLVGLDAAGRSPEIAGTAGRVLGASVRAFGCWGCLVAILGFGRVYLNSGDRRLTYASEAVLPFYMLHQTVIVIIGFFIWHWQMAIGLKYAFLVATAFVVIMILYEFVVRRVNVLRPLFGLKMRPRARPAAAPSRA